MINLALAFIMNFHLSVFMLHAYPHSGSEYRLPDLALSSGHSCGLPSPLPVGRDPTIGHADVDHHHGNPPT